MYVFEDKDEDDTQDEAYQINEHNIDTPIELLVNAAQGNHPQPQKVMMDKDTWMSISSEAKSQWDKILDDDKAKILKYISNKPSKGNIGSSFQKKPFDKNKKSCRSNVHKAEAEPEEQADPPDSQPAIEVTMAKSKVFFSKGPVIVAPKEIADHPSILEMAACGSEPFSDVCATWADSKKRTVDTHQLVTGSGYHSYSHEQKSNDDWKSTTRGNCGRPNRGDSRRQNASIQDTRSQAGDDSICGTSASRGHSGVNLPRPGPGFCAMPTVP